MIARRAVVMRPRSRRPDRPRATDSPGRGDQPGDLLLRERHPDGDALRDGLAVALGHLDEDVRDPPRRVERAELDPLAAAWRSRRASWTVSARATPAWVSRKPRNSSPVMADRGERTEGDHAGRARGADRDRIAGQLAEQVARATEAEQQLMAVAGVDADLGAALGDAQHVLRLVAGEQQ